MTMAQERPMRFAKLLRLAPLLPGLAGIAPALAHDVSAEMATLEERGPPSEIEGCRIFGGIATDYKNVEPTAGVKTPTDNSPRPVEATPTPP
jgi:hypothetical protein